MSIKQRWLIVVVLVIHSKGTRKNGNEMRGGMFVQEK
jgi:hypothetical protein